MRNFLGLMMAALLALVCIPAEAQVPLGLMSFGTTGAYNPQAGNCLEILALNSSGQSATDSGTPCNVSYLTSNYTNATTAYTAVLSLPITQASTTNVGECYLNWQDSSTSGTVTFAAGLSATPTDLWTVAVTTAGAYLAPTATTITSTTTTAITTALATAAAATPYQTRITFTLADSAIAANTLTIYAESNNASYTATVLAGSWCAYVP